MELIGPVGALGFRLIMTSDEKLCRPNHFLQWIPYEPRLQGESRQEPEGIQEKRIEEYAVTMSEGKA